MRIKKFLENQGNAVILLAIEGITTDIKKDLKFLPQEYENVPAFVSQGENSELMKEFREMTAESIGSIEYMHLKNFFIYTHFIKRSDSLDPFQELHRIASISNQVGLHLWKIRDNSVNLNNGFMLEKTNKGVAIHKNYIKTYFFNREGKANNNTNYSWEEIKKALTRAMADVLSHEIKQPSFEKGISTSRIKGTLRYQRFYYWVNDARKQDDLLLRLSLYVTSLEALLSTTQSELSHTLSERVALYLQSPQIDSLLNTYKKMKQCYSMRSKGLHGDTIRKEQQAELQELCVFLDDTCRNLATRLDEDEEFLKIISDDSLLNEMALKLLFRSSNLV